MSVFIIDDDIFYTSIVERHLENFKVDKIHLFTKVDEAVNRISIDKPKLIFLDMYLEKTNALEYLKKIKVEYPDIYIVVMTSAEDEELRNKCYDNGAYYFLVKNKNLEKSIAKILQNVNQYSEHFQ